MIANMNAPGVVDLPTKVMQLSEIRTTLEWLRNRLHFYTGPRKLGHTRLNYIIFRLSTCCGLRGCEIRRLRLNDFLLGGSRPIIRIRKEITKGKSKTRSVPLWWDRGTYEDIVEFVEWRLQTQPADAVAVYPSFEDRHHLQTLGEFMHRRRLIGRWDRFMAYALGLDRAKQLGVHAGRHSFCSHALATGRTLAEVRDAAGHANISITNVYVHALETGDDLPDVFPGEDEESL